MAAELVIALSGVVVAVLAIVVSAYYSYKSSENTKGQLESDMYEKLAHLEHELVICRTKEEYNEDVYENIQELICNRYEIYCYNYLKNRIDRKSFREMYSDNLITLYENPDYSKFFSEKGGYNYSNIAKVITEVRKKK